MTIFVLIFGFACCLFSSQAFAIGDTWTTKTSMPTARYVLGGSVVNGKIYAIGGSAGGFQLTILEEYDPATDTWATKTSMPTARNTPTCNTVNGKIYAIGGWNGSYLNTVEEYDPATDMWTNCGGTCTSMPTARDTTTSNVVNGKIYVIGGYNGSYLNTVEEYTPPAPIPEPNIEMFIDKVKIDLKDGKFKIKGYLDIDDQDFENLILDPQFRLRIELQTDGTDVEPDFGIIGEEQVPLTTNGDWKKLKYEDEDEYKAEDE